MKKWMIAFLMTVTTCWLTAGNLQPKDLEYLGAFRLPPGGNKDALTWNYAGSAMTYYPKGDPQGPKDGFPGSIFGTGHEQHQYVSEFSIPKPVKSKNLNKLPRAKLLQPFTDIRFPSFKQFEMPRVGITYLPQHGKQNDDYLFFIWAQHLDEVAEKPTLGAHKLKLSDKKSWGPWKIEGKRNYLTSDYLFAIPEKWAKENTDGNRLAMGRYRDGGQSSQGPTIIVAIDPAKNGNLPPANAAIKCKTLLQYPTILEDPKAKKSLKGYTHADAWNGAVWVDSKGKQAMVFTGIKGNGKCWYGYGNGLVWPEEPPFPPEPEDGERGWWAKKFTPMFLFYNTDDLAKVAKGKMKPNEPQPYAKLDISKHLFNIPKNRIWMMLGASCIDNKNGIIYMFEWNGDKENSESIVHVWKIK